MRKELVRNPGDALAYITDCTLATVEHMAMLKSRSKHEYKRQISIAQAGIDWLRDFGIPVKKTRIEEILSSGISVEEWAKNHEKPSVTSTK